MKPNAKNDIKNVLTSISVLLLIVCFQNWSGNFMPSYYEDIFSGLVTFYAFVINYCEWKVTKQKKDLRFVYVWGILTIFLWLIAIKKII